MPANVLCLLGEKGGIGRSTTSLNLAGYLSSKKKRVLLIDTDSQASLSQLLLGAETVDRLHKSNTVAGLFDDHFDIEPADVIAETSINNVKIVPSSDYLKEHNFPNPESTGELQFAIRELVEEVRGDFDFIIIDTPPDIGNLPSFAALLAADFVLTPIVPETFSAQAISGGDRMLAKAQSANSKLRFLGYFVNMRKRRSTFHDANEERLRAIHGDRVFDTVITNLTAFSEAQGLRKPVTHYAPKSDAALLTEKLAEEVLARIKKAKRTKKVA